MARPDDMASARPMYLRRDGVSNGPSPPSGRGWAKGVPHFSSNIILVTSANSSRCAASRVPGRSRSLGGGRRAAPADGVGLCESGPSRLEDGCSRRWVRPKPTSRRASQSTSTGPQRGIEADGGDGTAAALAMARGGCALCSGAGRRAHSTKSVGLCFKRLLLFLGENG